MENEQKHVCPVCGVEVSTARIFCSKQCATTHLGKQIMKEKYKQTMLKKYGVDNPGKLKQVIEKRKKTNFEKYGVEHVLQRKEIAEKVAEQNRANKEKRLQKQKQTMLQKYGKENALQVDEIKEKIKQTCLEKYGVENISQNEQIKQKKKQTYIEHFGVEHNWKSQQVREKQYKTYRTNHWNIYTSLLLAKNIIPQFEKEHYVNLDLPQYDFKCTLCQNTIQITDKTKATKPQLIFCPNHVHNVSKTEHEVAQWISQYATIETSKKFIFDIGENMQGNLFEIDIFLPDYNLGIEFCGEYWHSELFRSSDYHAKKLQYFTSKGIDLIEIFHSEWTNKKHIVQSIILNRIGKSKIIYGRQCTVKEIDNRLYEQFCVENHLQGYVRAKYKIGLFHNDELVSIISFSKARFNRQYEFELIRSCSKCGITIIGGFEKMFKYFIDKYNPSSIISYVDLRYFTGNSYSKVNMHFLKQTPPDYWYFKQGILQHRSLFQKHKLHKLLDVFDPSLTEHENMLNNGFYRVYDCGNKVFVWNRNNQ